MDSTADEPDAGATTEDGEAAQDEEPTGADDGAGAPVAEDPAAEDGVGAAADEDGPITADEAPPPPEGVSPERMQPVLSVSAFGQVTSL